MNKKAIAIIALIFVLIAGISAIVIGLSKPAANSDSNANNISPADNEKNNSINNGLNNQINNDTNNTINNGSNNHENNELNNAGNTQEEFVTTSFFFKTDKGEYYFIAKEEENGIYLDIESTKKTKTGYYITGYPSGHTYTTRPIIDPEESDGKDFYLPYLYMNEAIAFGGSSYEDYALYWEADKTNNLYNLSVRVVNIETGTLLDILDLSIEKQDGKMVLYVESADAYKKGEIDEEQKNVLIYQAIEHAKQRFPDLTDEQWEEWAREDVIIDLIPVPYTYNVAEIDTNTPYNLMANWPGCFNHLYAVSLPLKNLGYYTVYIDETQYLYSPVEITDTTDLHISADNLMAFAYGPVCTRNSSTIIPNNYKQADADIMLKKGQKQ